MRRQPPAPLLEDDPEEVSLADTTAGPGQEGITNENGQNRRVEVPGEPTTWRKSQSPESSPRSRASASWKRQSPIERGPDKSLDSAILLAHGKSREVMADLRSSRRTDIRSPWSCSLLTITTTLVAFLLVLSIIHSSLTRQLDPQGCVMSRMSPTYIKLSGFDTEHTRFATKYSLYLYREEGVDEYAQDRIGVSRCSEWRTLRLTMKYSSGVYPFCSCLAMLEAINKSDLFPQKRLGTSMNTSGMIKVRFDQGHEALTSSLLTLTKIWLHSMGEPSSTKRNT